MKVKMLTLMGAGLIKTPFQALADAVKNYRAQNKIKSN